MSWKSTWTYTKEVYHMDEELAQKAEELIQPEFEIEMTETLGKPQKDLGFDRVVDDTVELHELDPFAEEFELDGEYFVQDMQPSTIKPVDWEVLDAEALEEKAFEAEVEGLYEEAIVVAEESAEIGVEVAEAVAESAEITVEVVGGVAVAGAIAGAVVSAALMIGATLAGNYLLKKYRESKLPSSSDNNPFNASVGYLVLGKIWMPCYIDFLEDNAKGNPVASCFYFDITHFPRWTRVHVNDPTLQLLAPITKHGFWELTPKMVYKNKLIEVGFYLELPVATRVRLTNPHISRYKGKKGTILRGMIMGQDNKDGTWDKYRIKVDGVVDWYYERVYNFEIYDNKYVPKRYAKSNFLKP